MKTSLLPMYSKSLMTFLTVFAFSVAWLSTGTAFGKGKGGMDSGGGNVCVLDHQVRILELAELEPGAAGHEPGLKIRDTLLSNLLGIDQVTPLQGVLKEAVEIKIAALELQSPLLALELRRALQSMHFYITPFKPKKSARADFKNFKRCNEHNTYASVIYQNFGAIVSLPLFNALDLESQTAVLLHEALRVLQLNFDFEDAAKPTDADLQNLVIQFMRPNLNMDIYAFAFIQKQPAFQSFKFFDIFCERVKKSEDLLGPASIVSRQLKICELSRVEIEKAILESHKNLTSPEQLFLNNEMVPISPGSQSKSFIDLWAVKVSAAINQAWGSQLSNQFESLVASFNHDVGLTWALHRWQDCFDGKSDCTVNEKKDSLQKAREYKSLWQDAIENLKMLNDNKP